MYLAGEQRKSQQQLELSDPLEQKDTAIRKMVYAGVRVQRVLLALHSEGTRFRRTP
jgi:hypothetical protein